MIYNFLIKATKGKYASCSLYYTEIRGRYISFFILAVSTASRCFAL